MCPLFPDRRTCMATVEICGCIEGVSVQLKEHDPIGSQVRERRPTRIPIRRRPRIALTISPALSL